MKKLIGLLLVSLIQISAWAEINISSLFSDGAVLQQKAEIPVWGWAPEGTKVSVKFKGQEKATTVDSTGKWMVKFAPVNASAEGAKMIVTVGSESKTIKDILVGEVWICGGQSNMDFRLNMLIGKAREPQYQPQSDYIRKEIDTANDPLLRQIKVPRTVSAFEEKVNFVGKWEKAVPKVVGNFTATGYFYARELRKKLNVPVGLLNCNWGGTRVEPWIPMSKFQTNDSLKKYYDTEVGNIKKQLASWNPEKVKATYAKRLADWKVKAAEAKKAGKKPARKPRSPQKPDTRNTIPSTLYNSMLNTLVPYAVKGAIWYQGESNAGHYADKYQEHFSALIEAWREQWGQKDFYFYWCQLAQFKAPNAEPLDKDGWATVINEQRLTLSLPQTGMAVLNDVGEAKDIHPHNKMEAGKRMSLWAFKQAYGQELVYSGPLYKSSETKGDKVIVTFDHVGEGLMTGKKPILDPVVEVSEPLKRFQIRGADNKWYWANAKITGKATVEVSHEKVSAPVEVRYAWSANAEGANLYNKSGLPASVFSTK
ncbi:MAG: sialate O-acetylesterase [Lentisphaeraceae bacterium]|nr:sialate O-acetylesterase [Lentisphaeraceae bacterium]